MSEATPTCGWNETKGGVTYVGTLKPWTDTLESLRAKYDELLVEAHQLRQERDEAQQQEKIHLDNFLSAEDERVEMAKMLRSEREMRASCQNERDHYKQALEEISSSVQDWLDSLIQEPSLDFIHAIKAWADKKLKEI